MAKKPTKKRNANQKPAAKAPVVVPDEPKAPIDPITDPTPEIVPEAAETNDVLGVELATITTEYTLKDILMMYNSVVPSRRRWIKNRNALRNTWKELFILLEQASGRDGTKATLYDFNWHKMIDKGGTEGLTSKSADEIIVMSGEQVIEAPKNMVNPEYVAKLEAEIVRLTGIIEDTIMAAAPVGGKLVADEPLNTEEDANDEATTVKEASKTPQTEEPAPVTTE